MTALKKIIAFCMTTSSLASPLAPVSAEDISFADPVPNAVDPSCPPDIGFSGGIGYEWTVEMGKHDKASLVRHVGAKSWHEVPPDYTPPETGRTHTSDWIALDLAHPATLSIEVRRQEGVIIPSATLDENGAVVLNQSVAGNKLYPAFSLYKDWDDTSCEDHRYNNSDNFWATIKYLANGPNEFGLDEVSRTLRLPAGKHSIAVGGANASFCAPTDPCYSGRHGYRVKLKTR